MSAASDFLRSLWDGKPDEHYILIWSLAGKHSAWFQSVDEAAECALRLGESGDVYCGAGLSSADHGPDHRCPADEITGIAGLWADIDIASQAHKGKKLPSTRAEALSLLPPWFRPTYIVHTGNGIHIWLLFREPWMFTDAAERGSAASLELRFQTMLMLRAKEKGWQFERLADLARVLRIPGTKNFKSPDRPLPVEVVSNSGPRWNPSEIADLLDEMQISGDAVRPPMGEFNFAVNPEPLVPQALLDSLLLADATFRATWEQKRRNLADTSPSGYELAIANIGVMAALDDQTIVNLMIAWRQKHGHPPKLRPDYFARTLARAKSVIGGPEPPAAPAAGAVSESLKRLREALGLPVARIYKTGSAKPLWRFVLDDNRAMEVPADILCHQHRFAVALYESFNYPLHIRKESHWRNVLLLVAQSLSLEPLDRGQDTTTKGILSQWLATYLAQTPFQTEPLHQVKGMERLLPVVREGRVAVSSQHLRLYVAGVFKETVSAQNLAGMLDEIGAKPYRERIGRNGEQSRWLLPQADYPPESYTGESKEEG